MRTFTKRLPWNLGRRSQPPRAARARQSSSMSRRGLLRRCCARARLRRRRPETLQLLDEGLLDIRCGCPGWPTCRRRRPDRQPRRLMVEIRRGKFELERGVVEVQRDALAVVGEPRHRQMHHVPQRLAAKQATAPWPPSPPAKSCAPTISPIAQRQAHRASRARRSRRARSTSNRRLQKPLNRCASSEGLDGARHLLPLLFAAVGDQLGGTSSPRTSCVVANERPGIGVVALRRRRSAASPPCPASASAPPRSSGRSASCSRPAAPCRPGRARRSIRRCRALA